MNKTAAIIRQLKIDMITGEPNHIIDWFNDIWCRLSIVETNVYHQDGNEFIYYIVTPKQWIFFQDNKNDRFWCNYGHYWSILENNKDFEYSDIQEVTKLLIENALNNEVATPRCLLLYRKNGLEPASTNESLTAEVENALNIIFAFK